MNMMLEVTFSVGSQEDLDVLGPKEYIAVLYIHVCTLEIE